MIETEGLTRNYDTEPDRIARLCHKAQSHFWRDAAVIFAVVITVLSLAYKWLP